MKGHEINFTTPELATTGLSTRAIGSVRKIGQFLGSHPSVIELGIGGVLVTAHYLAGHAIVPDQPVANIVPFVPMVRAAGHDAAFAIGTAAAELSKAAILMPLFNLFRKGIVTAINTKDKQREHEQRLIEGREPLTNSAVLTIDLTNREGTGNHEGELVDAIWKHKEKNSEIWETIESVFGPICELVKNGAPQPADIPENQYLRMKTEGFRDPDTLKKRGVSFVSAMLLCTLDKDHTVFDNDEEAQKTIDEIIPRLIGACDNVESIQGELKQQLVQLPKIAIVNDRDLTQHEGLNPVTGEPSPQVGKLADYFPGYQGYETIIAEEVVIKHLLTTLQGKKVALFSPKGGEKIAANFHSYLMKYIEDHNIADSPEFIPVEQGKLEDSLTSGRPDMIFLMGENDTSVAGAAENIILYQSTIETQEQYPMCPVISFMEGHSADSTLKKVKDFTHMEEQKGLELDAVYLHDMLADEVAQRLLVMAEKLKTQAGESK